MAESNPSLTEGNGAGDRDASGRFLVGNRASVGNPHAKPLNMLRARLVAAVTAEDVDEIVAMLKAKAKGGCLVATELLFDRLFGKSRQPVDLDVDSGRRAAVDYSDDELVSIIEAGRAGGE